MNDPVLPFWKVTTLEEMTVSQWESLCDGCGRCCLNKLEFEDTGDIAWTNVACKMLDPVSCRCKDYPNRRDFVPECIQLTAKEVRDLSWLPPTCGYRLVRDGVDLYWWHPLISGDPETVHHSGISVRNKTISEEIVDIDDFENYEVAWPMEVPNNSTKDSSTKA